MVFIVSREGDISLGRYIYMQSPELQLEAFSRDATILAMVPSTFMYTFTHFMGDSKSQE